MKNVFKAFLLFWAQFLIVQSFSTIIDHKSINVSAYMDQISKNQDEKSQIIEYIHSGGVYLDIGSGADTIAHVINNTNNIKYKIILGDLEKEVLVDSLRKHPWLLNHVQGSIPTLELRQINAVNMVKLDTNSVDAISASALLHEVFSYCPSKNSIEQFLAEVCRLLKEGGTFIYRDAAALDHTDIFNVLELKTKLIREFFNVWSAKFFNREFSNIIDKKALCNKPLKHDASKIIVSFSKKESGHIISTNMFLDEFMITPSDEIDFDSSISIVAPRLFISELLRHFVLFLQDNKDAKILDALTTSGFSMFLKNKSTVETLKNLFGRGVQPNLVKIADDSIILDVKIISLLWKSKYFNGTIDYHNSYEGILDWLNREGEEHYFYFDLDSLITYVAQFSIDELKNTKTGNYVFVPSDTSGIRFYERTEYKKTLSQHACLQNLMGDKQEILTHKNIIHFKMVHLNEGIDILSKIASKHNLMKLKIFIQSLSLQ